MIEINKLHPLNVFKFPERLHMDKYMHKQIENGGGSYGSAAAAIPTHRSIHNFELVGFVLKKHDPNELKPIDTSIKLEPKLITK